LDDYNKEVEEGCHITCGTWMSIVEGVKKNNVLHFSPKIPKEWKAYSLKSILGSNFKSRH
jgi:maltose phosphorylase